MSKIFVTGSTGFLAGHLIPKLQKLGHEVITDYRYFNDPYDVLIHLAAVTHIRPEFDPKLFEANIILTNEVFKKNCRILYASSCSAAHDTNPYAQSKMWSEYLGKKHGNAMGFRFHNIYGPGNNKGIVWYLMNQLSGAAITIRGPKLIRDYIYVEDVVNEIIRNMSVKKIEFFDESSMWESYNLGVIDIGTGIGTSTMELVNLYMKLSGKTFIIDTAPPGNNEPEKMVSNNIVPHISLEEGLLKLIHNAE